MEPSGEPVAHQPGDDRADDDGGKGIKHAVSGDFSQLPAPLLLADTDPHPAHRTFGDHRWYHHIHQRRVAAERGLLGTCRQVLQILTDQGAVSVGKHLALSVKQDGKLQFRVALLRFSQFLQAGNIMGGQPAG